MSYNLAGALGGINALTLIRPWDQSILVGPKRIENRKWAPPTRFLGQQIALHAGEKWDENAVRFMAKHGFVPPCSRDESPRQAIVGLVTIAHVWEKGTMHFSEDGHDYASPWAFGPYCWFLSSITPLRTPVPCKGALGLWRVPDDLAKMVLSQVA